MTAKRTGFMVMTLVLLVATAGCDNGAADDPAAALAQRGRVVFETNCTACHSRTPSQPGPVGPAVAGASLELLAAKVVRNEYPPGYEPKRNTNSMPPLVHLEKELPAVHAYLQRAP